LRDKLLLTDRENERAFADIIENVLDFPIKLSYTSRPIANVYTCHGVEDVRHHTITLGRIKGVDKFTLLNHEVGHILGKSPTRIANLMLDIWCAKYKEEYRDGIKQYYFSALNFIEDERIEYLMEKLYLNNKRRFYRAKIAIGRRLKEPVEYVYDPLSSLEAVRFLSNGAVNSNYCYDRAKKVLNEVKGTGVNGGLIGLSMYKSCLDYYIVGHLDLFDRDSLNQIGLFKVDEFWLSKNQRWSADEVNHTLEDIKEVTDYPERLLKDSRIDGEKEVERIKALLCGVNDSSKVGLHGTIEEPSDWYHAKEGKPIEEISSKMNRMFRNMCEIPKSVIGYEGDEVDIESYISNKIDGGDITKCLINKRYVSGASILVSVDASTSMEDGSKNSSMSIARDMVATMYKSIENVDNIDLRSIAWSSSLSGDFNVRSIKSLKDTKNIYAMEEYPLTPTHLAIDYSTRLLKIMKGRRKLLILITDGEPQYMKNGMFHPVQTLVKMCRNSMIRGQRRCDNIIVMLIKPTATSEKYCKEIFNDRLIVVNDMKDGSDIIMNKFKRLVMGVLS